MKDVQGKKFMVLAGNPREKVDSFRFYANTSVAPSGVDALLADLRRAGAEVTLVVPHKNTLADQEGVKKITQKTDESPLQSAEDMARLAEDMGALQPDYVLQLASVSTIRCAHPVEHKIQKTGDQRNLLFEVVPNIDLFEALQKRYPHARLAGFDGAGEWQGDKAFHKVEMSPKPAEPFVQRPPEKDDTRPHVVVTLGRTEEKLTQRGDIITNFFSGRQGIAIARAFAEAGALVTVVAGPTRLELPKDPAIQIHRVNTAVEMHAVAQSVLEGRVDAFVGVAAVADFGVKEPVVPAFDAPGGVYALPLCENPSIVGMAARHAKRPAVVVSFAAQSPENILTYARAKFEKMGVDLTVANPIGQNTPAFADPTKNLVYFVDAEGVNALPVLSKDEVAQRLVRKVWEKLGSSALRQ